MLLAAPPLGFRPGGGRGSEMLLTAVGGAPAAGNDACDSVDGVGGEYRRLPLAWCGVMGVVLAVLGDGATGEKARPPACAGLVVAVLGEPREPTGEKAFDGSEDCLL